MQIAGDLALDSAVMNGLCRDEDGCEVILSLRFPPFEIEESQARIVRRIFDAYATGAGFREIAVKLNANGTQDVTYARLGGFREIPAFLETLKKSAGL